MLIRHVLITALVIIGTIPAIALGIAMYRHDLGMQSWLEYTWMTSIAFSIIGYLCRSGATTGDNVARTEAVMRTSENKDGCIEADNDDAMAGYAFGLVVMFASLAVLALSLTVLSVFY